MKLILIDGPSVLSTCFYGSATPQYNAAKTEKERAVAATTLMQTKTGLFTNGIYAMTKILINLIKKEQPTHMAIAWDVSRDTFRKRLFSGYKANRGEAPDELKQQYCTMQKVLKEMGIAQFGLPNYEADDILGTLSKMFDKFIPTYILTKDCDALQLVSHLTTLWLITKKAPRNNGMLNNILELTPELVKQQFGLKPEQIVDKKALAGDPGDNIPGVAGIGEKTATILLQQFGTLENIYQRLKNEKAFRQELKDLGIKRIPIKNLAKGMESAFLSKKLATIKTNITELKNTLITDLLFNFHKERAYDFLKNELEIKTIML